MEHLKKKVCMLGAFSVGKTSLVARFVHSIFSEKYQTTIGVKVDKKTVSLGDSGVTLLIWDLHGEDDVHSVRASYLRGSAGYLLVADGTRAATLGTAEMLHARMREAVGDVPFVLLVNKADLASEWEVAEPDLARLESEGWPIVRTSALSGDGVEDAFGMLARALVARDRP
jgi:small GTP-binding protein